VLAVAVVTVAAGVLAAAAQRSNEDVHDRMGAADRGPFEAAMRSGIRSRPKRWG
jgi:hypothetical protein